MESLGKTHQEAPPKGPISVLLSKFAESTRGMYLMYELCSPLLSSIRYPDSRKQNKLACPNS